MIVLKNIRAKQIKKSARRVKYFLRLQIFSLMFNMHWLLAGKAAGI